MGPGQLNLSDMKGPLILFLPRIIHIRAGNRLRLYLPGSTFIGVWLAAESSTLSVVMVGWGAAGTGLGLKGDTVARCSFRMTASSRNGK